ncbi:MAG TPA: hypothetical protein VFL94_10670 [Actinomycetales bacterium]|nr:hypothetical protein [Actinomycetales bacterium]
MTASEDLAAAAEHVSALRDTVASLQAHVGETVDLARLKDDVARLRADLQLVARACGLSDAPQAPGEKVYIPDGDYDPSFWVDADDEGLGAIGRKG